MSNESGSSETPPQPFSYMNQLANLSKTVNEQQHELNEIRAQLSAETGSPPDEMFEEDNMGNDEGINEDTDPFGIMFQSRPPPEASGDDDFFAPLQDAEETPEFGVKVLPEISEGMKKCVTRPLLPESFQKWTKTLLVPENCKPMMVPKMNPEIWNNLPGKARVSDHNAQQQQQMISMGLVSLTQIAQEVALNKDTLPPQFGQKILQLCKNGANVLGHGFQQSVSKRRTEVKQYLQSDYMGICNSTTPVTEFLFGDDLKELAKSSKAALQLVKRGYSAERTGRYSPYNKRPRFPSSTSTTTSTFQPKFSGNLNRPRPSYGQFNNRRGGFRTINRPFRPQQPWKAPNDYRRQ